MNVASVVVVGMDSTPSADNRSAAAVLRSSGIRRLHYPEQQASAA
jgi:hypothetical protein